MSRTKALLWKEWHEVRVLLAIALFVFVGLPMIGALEDRVHRFSASPWVFLLGGLLAVLVGVGTVSRDLNGRLEDFWRSRPVSLLRWVLVKYFIGLGVVLAAVCIPLVIEIMLNQGLNVWTNPTLILAWNPFLWTAGYSVAFAAACLVRRPAHAAVISIAALLLLYFLPYVLPPIQFMELSWVMDASEFPRVSGYTGHVLSIYHRIPWMPWRVLYEPRQLLFVLGMLVVAVAGLALALAAIEREWRIESGQKLVYWSIGGVILVVLSTIALQVGTNLPVLQRLDLPENCEVEFIQSDGSRGVMLTWTDKIGQRCQTLRFAPTGLEMGPPLAVENSRYMNLQGAVWLPEHPNILYVPGDRPIADSKALYPTLSVVNLNDMDAHTETLSFPEDQSDEYFPARVYAWNGQLYFLGINCRTFDLSEPLKPHLVSTEQITWQPLSLRRVNVLSWLIEGGASFETGMVYFPDIPGLSPRQRLETVLGPKAGLIDEYFSDDVLTTVDASGGRLTTCRLEQLNDHSATFRRLGVYTPTSLESFYGSSGQEFAQRNGLFYESLRPSQPWDTRRQLGGARLTVFSVDGPRPRPVFHFAAPDERSFLGLCPLPDGRLLLGGEHHLYLLGPPPGKR